ncbi:MAG: hypothetical protein KAT48_15155 [Bacteroidales bacterium]|nr:hypothetical protein [Bacteroidales bacterium]
MMKKFEFLLGNWTLEYKIPKSGFSEAATGFGTGNIKRMLDNKYVFFDYSASFSLAPQQKEKAHAIFQKQLAIL